ncbi:MAG: tol-pal system protein YbgF, partial [Thiothrix sp.]
MNQSKSKSRGLLFAAVVTMVVLQPAAWARMNKQEAERFEQMVTRLEQAEGRAEGNNRRQQKMFQRLEAMSTENRSLRGEIEQLNHQIGQMKKRQRELYLDMEQRLQLLESNSSGSVAGNGKPESGRGGETSDIMVSDSSNGESAPQDEQSHYQRAFELLKSGQHQPAITGFQTFLETYPDSTVAANAQYWLGEAHYGAAQFEQAVREFEKVRTLYPNAAKVGDASLKLAYSYYELQQWDGARSVLEEINK